MNNFKLEPVDIGVNLIRGNDPYSRAKRWVLGSPFSHVFMYLGEVGLLVSRRQRRIIRIPMIFESIGRGVLLRNLSARYGEEVVVMRLISEHDRRRIGRVLEEAVKLSSNTQAYYDYLAIVRWVLPQLICEKLGLPIAAKYQRNLAMICSEACAEVFWRAGIEIVPKDIVPLPSSFIESELLIEAWQGRLSEDVISLPEAHTVKGA